MPIDNIPKEILFEIFNFLDSKSLGNISLLNKKFNAMSKEHKEVLKEKLTSFWLNSLKDIIDSDTYQQVQLFISSKKQPLACLKKEKLDNFIQLYNNYLKDLKINNPNKEKDQNIPTVQEIKQF